MKKLMFIFIAGILMAFISGTQGYSQTVVQGDITADTTWSSDVLLRGPVFVRKPATLTVQAGVTVKGEKSTLGALIIEQGAKLIAVGTENNPVVFTSDQPEGQRKRADWGGLIINGYSPLNTGTYAWGEGDTGYYGCDGNTHGVNDCNVNDNSGTLRYVRVEYGGIQFSPDNELNGIALQGTGSGTTLDHIQIHYSKDDGLEFFGGTTNVKYILLTGIADDCFDWTHGWRGSAQFVVTQHQCDVADCDKGIEADNLANNYDAQPRSNPTLYNFTLIGDPINGNKTVSTNGLTPRRGTGATIRNFIVQGFNRSGIDIDNLNTFQQAQNGTLTVSNSIWWMNANNSQNFYDDADDNEKDSIPFTTKQFMTSMMQHNLEADPLLANPYDWHDPDFRPAANSPAVNGAVPVAAPPPGNTFIVATNYIGAIDPAGDDWTRKPWTTFGARQETTTTTTAQSNTTTTVPTNTTTSVLSTTTTPAVSTTTSVSANCTDNDKDGYNKEGGQCGAVDCNDNNALIHPNAAEICNGVDDNCDGDVDEGVQNVYFRDADGDGFGFALMSTTGCATPSGYVEDNTDCADDDAAIHPAAEELCRDNKDNNCNGEIDEDCKLCASSKMLGAAHPHLEILRQFRDTVMARSLKGRIYTKLYYFYSDQVSAILDSDPLLREQAAALLASAIPSAEAALQSKTIVLNDAQKAQALAVLNKLGKQASVGLRLVILKVKSDIKKGSVL
jgi:hypothetical protein